MKMLIVAGFLGSGKTSLIMELVRRIHGRTGRKVAVMVNDFGKIGVDGKIMERQGFKVMEFWGGCFCCTLGNQLVTALEKVASEIKPSYIIVEPSGIADPQSILKTLKNYHGPAIVSNRIILIIDASRFDLLHQAMPMPLSNQVKSADMILINKIDVAEAGATARIRSFLREKGFAGQIFEISVAGNINLDAVFEAVICNG